MAATSINAFVPTKWRQERNSRLIFGGLIAGAVLTLLVPARADVQLPPVLSSHMVLQRAVAVPIWGTATAGEHVTVQFRNQIKSTIADREGKWQVQLGALQAGGPDTLTVTGNNTITLEDVLVGEVWVGSGQSNMALPVKYFAPQDEVLSKDAAASYPRLRLLSSNDKAWRESTPGNNAQFSALLFGFGMRLQKGLDVPVGLMIGAMGGTPSGFWVSQNAFNSDEAVQKSVAAYRPQYEAELKKAEEELAAWKQTPAAAEPNAKSPVRFPRYKPGEGLMPIGNLYRNTFAPSCPMRFAVCCGIRAKTRRAWAALTNIP